MLRNFVIFIILAVSTLGFPLEEISYTDRACGQDLSTLWLDIVIVVDNSKGMTNRGLSAVAADISSLFVENLPLGIQPNNPQTTRVAIVTYNTAATVVADLNTYKSVEQMMNSVYVALNKVTDANQALLELGLEKAGDLLETQSINTDRDHYKKLVIVYASEYRGTGQLDPLPMSMRLKESDIAIATVAYAQDNSDAFLERLNVIATPGFAFNNKDNTVLELRNAMLQVNCFCPNGWFQMRQSFSNPYSPKFGVCVLPVTLQATWLAAKLSCRNQFRNAYLVNEFTKLKHDYVLEAVRNKTAFRQPYTYFIGLTYSTGQWYWEQPVGQSRLPLQNTWTGWNPTYPVSTSNMVNGVAIQPSSSLVSTGWENTNNNALEYYVCEVASCDSTNYCDADND